MPSVFSNVGAIPMVATGVAQRDRASSMLFLCARRFLRRRVARLRHQIEHDLNSIAAAASCGAAAKNAHIALRHFGCNPQCSGVLSISHTESGGAGSGPDDGDRHDFPSLCNTGVAGTADNDGLKSLLPHLLCHSNHLGNADHHCFFVVDSLRLVRNTARLNLKEWKVLFKQLSMQSQEFGIACCQNADQTDFIFSYAEIPPQNQIINSPSFITSCSSK